MHGLLSVGAFLLAAATAQAVALAPGSPAPDFVLVDPGGASVSLSHFRGRRGVVLAWFPKAFTPG